MQEGILSLMQMAKTSGALARLAARKLPFISVLTNPSTAGVMASYASLGDVIIAEPDALIGFAGPRVIQQTINQILPKGFQKSDFVLEHGFLDAVVDRKDLKNALSLLLYYFTGKRSRSQDLAEAPELVASQPARPVVA
jgi:acetyl-CoA carboxylase carboxyl transferase subunit beta